MSHLFQIRCYADCKKRNFRSVTFLLTALLLGRSCCWNLC